MISDVYLIVSEEIDKWDPELLFEFGAPEDEYVPEIREIVNNLSKIQSEHALALLIKDVFEKYFDEKYYFESCLEIAINIWKRLKS